MRRRVASADEAVAIVCDGDTPCCSGFGRHGIPVELILALEKRFVASGGTKALTLSAHIYETQREALESVAVPPAGGRA